jgi:hypothetical protein
MQNAMDACLAVECDIDQITQQQETQPVHLGGHVIPFDKKHTRIATTKDAKFDRRSPRIGHAHTHPPNHQAATSDEATPFDHNQLPRESTIGETAQNFEVSRGQLRTMSCDPQTLALGSLQVLRGDGSNVVRQLTRRRRALFQALHCSVCQGRSEVVQAIGQNNYRNCGGKANLIKHYKDFQPIRPWQGQIQHDNVDIALIYGCA